MATKHNNFALMCRCFHAFCVRYACEEARCLDVLQTIFCITRLEIQGAVLVPTFDSSSSMAKDVTSWSQQRVTCVRTAIKLVGDYSWLFCRITSIFGPSRSRPLDSGHVLVCTPLQSRARMGVLRQNPSQPGTRQTLSEFIRFFLCGDNPVKHRI